MNFNSWAFNFVFCSNNAHLCCGGNGALLDMMLEMGVDVENKEVRDGLNAFFAERLGEGELFVGDWPQGDVEGYDTSAKYDCRESRKRDWSCPFSVYRKMKKGLSPMAIIALCAMYATRHP